MPWYGDYAMEGWANDNTAESWNTVMNNSYTLTLEDMPGWDNYEMETTIIAPAKIASPAIRLVGHDLQVNLNASTAKVSIFDMQGHQVMNRIVNGANACIKLNGIAAGQYIVKMQGNGFSQNTRIQVK